ncbi:Periplasmic pH-dependent serine endoprotease DegQ precursor [Tautonia plasticadhaerens]|uniref:Periplasmic pH-dependent serine endoprotease DegQ n=2 Tax=Tautonia plasticadhaerens TaxID=2527974 RepID=A0A518GZ46_9BACT|nr:Periplasmic pH-dependent serine endoprotease DegQ precursor [Tautonia plasticadhaerens]
MSHPIAPLLLALCCGPVGPVDDERTPPPRPIDVVSALESAVTDAIDSARPSVVTIDRIKSDDGRTLAVRGREDARPPGNPNGAIIIDGGFGFQVGGPESPDYPSFDFGSGVVVGDGGRILTAYHVVIGAARLLIRAPGLEPIEAEILAADPRSDLAVVAPVAPLAEIPGAPGLKPIAIGDASGLRPGSFLVALGNAHNASRDGQASASFGILANTARRLVAPPPEDFGAASPRQLQHYSTLFQLDSKLNLGMSGGAVVNLRGELVAITTASANAVGYDPRAGYAIPMDTLGLRVLRSLIEGEEVEYGFLGIRLQNPSNLVDEVQPGTPAGEGGLVRGDEIVEVSGLPITDFDSLIRAVNASPVGEPIGLLIRRDGRSLEKEVTLSKFPVEGEVIASNRPAPWRGARVDYSSVVGPGLDALEAMARGGVGVLEVVPGSRAEGAGLRAGTIISSVDGTPVRTPGEFREAAGGRSGRPVRLGTDRGTITVPPDTPAEGGDAIDGDGGDGDDIDEAG